MVAIVDKINGNRSNVSCSDDTNRIKQEDHHQTTRIIQWLGGERAVDVPAEFDIQSSIKEDCVDHHIVASKVECIELLRLKPSNKQQTTTFERGSLLRQSSRRGSCSYRSRSSPDEQTSDEAYCTLSTHRGGIEKKTKLTNDLIRKGSTSDSSSLSTTVHNYTSSPILTISIDDIYTTLDRAQILCKMEDENIKEDIGRLREIAQQGSFQQSLHLLPILTHVNDGSMDLFHEIMINGDNGQRDFKQMIEEFIQLIEKKLIDAEYTMFDADTIRASSPSLFDMLNDLKTCLTLLRRTEMQSFLNVFDNVLKLRLYPSALPENHEIVNNINNENISNNLNHSETTEELLKLSQYAIDELKIVKIEKTHEPLGLTITRSDSGTIHIARIIVGGIAANTQLFQINDRILEINDEPITGHSLDYVCSLMLNTTGLIKFLLAPPLISHIIHNNHNNNISYQTFYVRALYAYDPYNDPLLPCKELGLMFQRGDILRIVARDENYIKINDSYVSWWQAYRENSTETDTDPSLAGLIPSDHLQQKRLALIKALNDETESISSSSSTSISTSIKYLKKNKKKKKKSCLTCVSKKEKYNLHSVYNNATFIRDIDDTDTTNIRTSTNHFSLTDTRQFDEVQPSSQTMTTILDPNKDIIIDSLMINTFRFYDPVFRLDITRQQMTRPIVLLGAPNVGRHELRRRLLQTEPNLFDVAIPHTTRARRQHEIADIDYHFVSDADFLSKVACHSFVEFGQYDRDLYGTSIEDIRHIVCRKRKICILNLNPDAIRTFDKTDLYPYIICIAAPSFERLKRLEIDRRDHLTDNDYREIIRQSRSIERHHYLLFDYIIINNDLDRTYTELREIIVRIQHDDQQWVRTCYRQS
ncbi:unnamed protein product [Rotaria sordida]|uniref:Uncharacterized protein n=1 Tax=Rotaria sordida TaxID=392033 RepID=A0A814J0H6_9BILA|nr:unnamed protein product [Rotaria sordida]CAF1029539.1 unnamed protein product [Rotaria sordida]CAF1030277.1 unnamed protein product [Rotaria sordida]